MKNKTIIKSVGKHALEASGVVNNQAQPSNRTEQTKIQGILTSNLRTRKSSNTPYMAFFRKFRDCEIHTLEKCIKSQCKECEIPVVFRLKPCEYKDCQCHTYKPNLKKGDRVILEGEFSESKKSHRPSFRNDKPKRLSFTCYGYEVLKDYE